MASESERDDLTLQGRFPDIAAEWDNEKNLALSPSDVRYGSGKKVWWLCPKGHSYQAKVSGRTYMKAGCNVCSNRTVAPGINDMATIRPDLAHEFDLEKNALRPSELLPSARSKVWWLCPKGHSYYAACYSRVSGTGCPVCSNRLVLGGFNDLTTTHPDLARQFDTERNQPLTADSVIAGTNVKLWWICDDGHSYSATGNQRSGRGSGCPFCTRRSRLPGLNDMATLEPRLLLHFHPSKNGKDTPQNLSPRGSKKLWWICENGHEYQATPKNRLQPGGFGCPVCSNHQLLAGFNDLATTHPALAAEWHPTKNLAVKPNMVIAGTNRKFWWLCSEGHEWFAFLSLRAGGRGCPRCAKGGYDSTKPGWIYFISSTDLAARKIGITNHEMRRISQYESHWKVIQTWHNDNGLLIAEIETKTLRWIRDELGLPAFLAKSDMGTAGGYSETFSDEGPSNFEVIRYIDELFQHAKQTK